MKVRYIIDYPDAGVGPGYVFQKGTVAEHEDPEAQRRIDAGVCVAEHPEARARKLQPHEQAQFDCVAPEAPTLVASVGGKKMPSESSIDTSGTGGKK